MTDESKVGSLFHLVSLTTGEFDQLFMHMSVHGGSSSVNCLFLPFDHFCPVVFLAFFLLHGMSVLI